MSVQLFDVRQLMSILWLDEAIKEAQASGVLDTIDCPAYVVATFCTAAAKLKRQAGPTDPRPHGNRPRSSD